MKPLWLQHLWRQHQQLLALACGLAIVGGLLSHFKITESFDWLLFDTTQYASSLPAADDLVIIEIDEKSIRDLGRWPWPRDKHAELLQHLTDAGSKAVIFDVIFAEHDQQHPQADQQFARAIEQHGHVLLPLYLEQLGNHGQVLEITPAPMFYPVIKGIGHVHVSTDTDGVVRSIFLKAGMGTPFWPHLSLALLRSFEPRAPIPGTAQKTQTNDENLHLIAQNFHNWLPMPSATQGITHHSFVDVVQGHVDPSQFANKIVFIGATAPGLGDIFATSIGAMPGVELNMWAFHALRNNQTVQKASNTTTLTINSVVILIALLFLGRLNPTLFLSSSVVLIIALLTVSSLGQNWFRWWLPVMPAVLCIILFYPLWSWLRLEVALAFLRKELISLKLSASDSGPQPNLAAHNHTLFWNQLGLTKDQQLSLTHDQIGQNFDSESLAGTELVEQTIAQLIAVKRKADNNRRLIEQSLEQLQDAVAIADAGGQLMFINRAFESIFGSQTNNDSDLLSLLNALDLNGNRTWKDLLRRLYQGEESVTAQATIDNKQIDLFCQCRLISMSGDQRDTLVFTFTDVSELKAAEKARLEALNFLSHDLRSPMVSVLAILQLQRMRPEVASSALDDIEVLVRKNLTYADSFLQLSRAQSLQAEKLQLCDLHAVLDSAQMQGLALARAKDIELVTSRTDDDAWALGEHDMLERALINLLSNAIKYSPPKTTVTLSLSRDGDQLAFSVRDQGSGIATEDLPTLFERFTRSKKHQQEMGAGLGLHFVATVAKRHHGQVQVDSTLGKGSCFTLTLPLENPVDEPSE